MNNTPNKAEEIQDELDYPQDLGLSDKQKFIWSFLAVLFLSALPMLILWNKNAAALDILEGAFPVVLSMVVGTIVYFLLWFGSKKNSVFSGFLGVVISFILLGFGFFSSLSDVLLPFLSAGVRSLLVAVVLGGLMVFLAIKISKTETAPRLLMILGLTFTALFLYNTVKIVVPAYKRVNSYKPYEGMQSPKAAPLKDPNASHDMPNIYYILLDECADFYTMERYYGIPKAENPYYIYFKENDFNISTASTSRTNRSVYCMANIFALGYKIRPSTSSRGSTIDCFPRRMV